MSSLSRREVARWAAHELAHGSKNKTVAMSLAAYLADAKAFREVDLLLRDIEQFLAATYAHTAVHVSSAHPLGVDLKKQIIKQLGLTKNSTEISEEINPELLGGVIVSTAQKEYDGSLISSIKQLKALGN